MSSPRPRHSGRSGVRVSFPAPRSKFERIPLVGKTDGILFCMECENCEQRLQQKSQKKYCSNKCQANHQFEVYIKNWKAGKVDGGRGRNTRNISRHIKRYLVEKCGEACTKCGWNEAHIIGGVVPLEIDHIDGNSENNIEANLQLICPNCHSLTATFRNRNYGKGRDWRKEKYRKGK